LQGTGPRAMPPRAGLEDVPVLHKRPNSGFPHDLDGSGVPAHASCFKTRLKITRSIVGCVDEF
jgi:hypothetical protein